MAGVQVRFTGRVQGVGFRSYVQRRALKLGVRGTVWNCLDGSVMARMFHEERATLDLLVSFLQTGPVDVRSAEVLEVDDEPVESFTIGATR